MIKILGWSFHFISFFIRIELIARDNCADESAHTNLAIVEIKAEKSLRQADTLGCSDHISEVLKEIKSVVKLLLVDSSPLSLEIIDLSLVEAAPLWSIVSLHLSIFFGGLKDLDHNNYHWEYKAKKPEKCGTLGGFCHVYILQELYFGEDLHVIEDPIEEEAQSS